MNWYLNVLKNYVQFSGRARRTEYWVFSLISFIITIALSLLNENLATLYTLAVLLPSLAVLVRRLHDTNRSGWWLLIALIPVIGGIVLIVFAAQNGHPGANQYGETPKEVPPQHIPA